MQFCPKCKSLMLPKAQGKKIVITCLKCGFTDKKLESEPMIEKVQKREELKVVAEGEEVLPKAKAKCPACNHGEAYYWLQQTRAGDEPETRFFKCVKCKHTWRDYS